MDSLYPLRNRVVVCLNKIFHIWGSLNSVSMMSFNVILSPLYFCILAVRSRSLVRLDLIFCQEHFTDSVAWFHQEALMSDCSSLCDISSHWWSLPSVTNYRRLRNDNFIILSFLLYLLAEIFFYEASSLDIYFWHFALMASPIEDYLV